MMSLYENLVFPWILELTNGRALAEQRSMAVREVAGDVLELGLGTGLTLPYYPQNVQSIAAVEPNRGMHRLAEKRALRESRSVRVSRQTGERLPFEARSFDAVVSVLVLCSVEDVAAVLTEAYRVLRAGGTLHFLEHVASKDPRVRAWQQRLNHLHKVLACGCELQRDTERFIRDSEFTVSEIEHVTLPGLQALYPLIRGRATKEDLRLGGAPDMIEA